MILVAAAGATGGWFWVNRGQPGAAAPGGGAVGQAEPGSFGGGATTASGGGSAGAAAGRAGSSSPSPTGLAGGGVAAGHAGLVTISLDAAVPGAHHVAAFLSGYFQAINAKNYPAYRSMYDPTSNPAQSRAGFRSGYRTTRDDGITLAALVPSCTGGWLATVKFTSHQAEPASKLGTSCTRWTVVYALAPAGASFVLEHVPAGYLSVSAACPV